MTILRMLAAIVGGILLLPGLCTVFFMFYAVQEMTRNSGNVGELTIFIPFWIVGALLSAGGIVLIRRATRRRSDASGPEPRREGSER